MIVINDDELQRHKCIEHSHHNRTLSGCGGGCGGWERVAAMSQRARAVRASNEALSSVSVCSPERSVITGAARVVTQ